MNPMAGSGILDPAEPQHPTESDHTFSSNPFTENESQMEIQMNQDEEDDVNTSTSSIVSVKELAQRFGGVVSTTPPPGSGSTTPTHKKPTSFIAPNSDGKGIVTLGADIPKSTSVNAIHQRPVSPPPFNPFESGASPYEGAVSIAGPSLEPYVSSSLKRLSNNPFEDDRYVLVDSDSISTAIPAAPASHAVIDSSPPSIPARVIMPRRSSNMLNAQNGDSIGSSFFTTNTANETRDSNLLSLPFSERIETSKRSRSPVPLHPAPSFRGESSLPRSSEKSSTDLLNSTTISSAPPLPPRPSLSNLAPASPFAPYSIPPLTPSTEESVIPPFPVPPPRLPSPSRSSQVLVSSPSSEQQPTARDIIPPKIPERPSKMRSMDALRVPSIPLSLSTIPTTPTERFGGTPLVSSATQQSAASSSTLLPEACKPIIMHTRGSNRRAPHYKSSGSNPSIQGTLSTKHMTVCNGNIYAATSTTLRLHKYFKNVESVQLPLESASPYPTSSFSSSSSNANKIMCMVTTPALSLDQEGENIWIGFDKGELVDFHVPSGRIVERRSIHSPCAVTHLLRGRQNVYSLDENGAFKIWYQRDSVTGRLSLNQLPRALRISPKILQCLVAPNGHIWASHALFIEIYDPTTTKGSIFMKKLDLGGLVGSVTCFASISLQPNHIIASGHEDGKIVLWTPEFRKLRILALTSYRLSSMLSFDPQSLWAATATGRIFVVSGFTSPSLLLPSADSTNPGQDSTLAITKDFPTSSGVIHLTMDMRTFLETGQCVVISLAESSVIQLWDGLLTEDRFLDSLVKIEQRFCDFTPIHISQLSWNLDSSSPTALDASSFAEDVSFFSNHFIRDFPAIPHIVVIGFQELINLESGSKAAKSIFSGNKNSDNFVAWVDRISRALLTHLPQASYVPIEPKQLVGLGQIVYIRTDLQSSCSNMRTECVKTGLGGFHGNKGAIVTRLCVADTSFCFVNCHLAAHQSNIAARNADCVNILRDAAFPAAGTESPLRFVCGGDGTTLMDHDVITWAGDMNYRMDTSRDVVEDHLSAVASELPQNCWSMVRNYDQLYRQFKQNSMFPLIGFHEGQITFPPTFKYDRGTWNFDSSEKRRVPAYCDRILWRSMKSTMTQHYYHSYPTSISDHRPVATFFTVQAKSIRSGLLDQVRGEVEERLAVENGQTIAQARALWEGQHTIKI